MIELIRIIEDQINMSSYRATLNEERAVQLEFLVELTKAKNPYADWHYLIATPFRYHPPFKNARFRPPFASNNIFYAALAEQTAFYEYSFHFMQERLHLKISPEIGQRTLFSVNANPETAIRLHTHPECHKIMDKHDYRFSHAFIEKHTDATFIIYPSCRDPENRDNAAVLDINHLDKKPKYEHSIKFFYDNEKKLLTWIDKNLQVKWDEVK